MQADEALGLSVAAASRVIEIDEVLVETMAFGLRKGHSATKILRLTVSSSVAASITRSASLVAHGFGIGDARERLALVVLADLAGRDLAGEVPVDGPDRRIDLVLGDVVERDVIAGERDDMGDAAPFAPRR